MSLAETSVLYAEVKAWIAQQEAFEKAMQTSAPLTNAQRKALEVLRAPISMTPPPELDDVDYVSLLTKYRQANPTGENIVWTEEDASTKLVGGTVGRICHVIISESRGHPQAPVESFPAIGYGLERGEDPPAFHKKKEAKQYAAKCATEWLIAQSFMPSNLKDVTFPKGHQPIRFVPSSSSASESSSSAATTPLPRPPTEGTSGVLDFKDSKDENLGAPEHVTALCAQLGLQTPKYMLDKSIPGVDRYYDGYADFGHENSSMADAVGCVKKVEGRQRAKLQVAELVLKYLLSVYRDRQSMSEELSMPPEGAAL